MTPSELPNTSPLLHYIIDLGCLRGGGSGSGSGSGAGGGPFWPGFPPDIGGGSGSGSGSGGGSPTPPDPNEPENWDQPKVPGLADADGNTLTYPIFDVEEEEDEEEDCEELNKISEIPDFSSKMQELKNNLGGDKEKGFIIRDIPNNEISDVATGDDDGNIPYPYEDQTQEERFKTYGVAHNHLENNPDHIGIFTPEDLGNLLLNAMIETSPDNPYQKDTPEKSTCMVITNIGFFAVRVNDLSKLFAFIIEYGSWTKFEKDRYFDKIFQNPNKYNINSTATHNEQVTGFLRFMQDQDLGIDLFEGDENSFGNWKKLSLNNNGNGNYSYDEFPCD